MKRKNLSVGKVLTPVGKVLTLIVNGIESRLVKSSADSGSHSRLPQAGRPGGWNSCVLARTANWVSECRLRLERAVIPRCLYGAPAGAGRLSDAISLGQALWGWAAFWTFTVGMLSWIASRIDWIWSMGGRALLVRHGRLVRHSVSRQLSGSPADWLRNVLLLGRRGGRGVARPERRANSNGEIHAARMRPVGIEEIQMPPDQPASLGDRS